MLSSGTVTMVSQDKIKKWPAVKNLKSLGSVLRDASEHWTMIVPHRILVFDHLSREQDETLPTWYPPPINHENEGHICRSDEILSAVHPPIKKCFNFSNSILK